MEIRAVKKQIKEKQLGKFYLFTGEEIEAQRIYIDKMAETTDRIVTRVETVADVFKYKSGIIKTPRLFVVRDDKDFMQADKAWDKIDDLLGDKILVFQITAVDKRTKFYKHFEEQIVTFNHMDMDVLYKYVQKGCKLSDGNTEHLIKICSNDYGRLLLEMDKINRYAKVTNQSLDKAYEQLVADGTIYREPEDAIFDFVDAVLQVRPKLAYRLLEDCKAFDEGSVKLISVLYNSMKKVLQVQTCDSRDISGATGLSAWEIKCARKNLNYWKSEDLVYFLKLLQGAERAIKTGEIEESVAIDYVLTRIF